MLTLSGLPPAELALANMNLDRGATDAMKADALGEVHQRFGHPRLEMPKHDVLDLLGSQPQAAAQDFKD